MRKLLCALLLAGLVPIAPATAAEAPRTFACPAPLPVDLSSLPDGCVELRSDDPADPFICPVLVTIGSTQVLVFVVIDSQGDVYVWGAAVWDCPPYNTEG